VLKRLPVRFNYDDNYYNKKYQGIPAEGYSEVIRKILDHPLISVEIGRKFSPRETTALSQDYSHLFYTGPLDAFFGHREGRLGYRTVLFEKIATDAQDYQGNAVVNYPDMSVPYTRIHEHKHFAPWEKHGRTSVYKEFSKETEEGDVPYYPKRLASDKAILAKYRALGEETALGAKSRGHLGLSFLGHLATYRYMDMETVIGEALEFSDKFIDSWQAKQPLPVFPNSES